MNKTDSKIHLHDMVTIDTTVFEIVWGGGGVVGWLLTFFSFLNYTGLEWVKKQILKKM